MAVRKSCHAEDKEEFIREACRLLKPGGLVINDYFRNDPITEEAMQHYETLC